MHRLLRKFIAPVLPAALLLLAVRGLLISPMRLPEGQGLIEAPTHRLVWLSRTYYGLRLPGESLWGYHRWGYRMPQVGEALAFTQRKTLPQGGEAEEMLAAVCRAIAGDTVWIDPVRRLILPAHTSPDAEAFVVPRADRALHVTPHNARLLARILRRYEGVDAKVDGQGRLWIRGEEVRRVRTAQDYYWVEMFPERYALIPHRALVGRIIPMQWGKEAS
ncbi:MAG: hypothetical protein Q4P78_08750 [Rothia sp. (in: high G+C Gram-positive bacteria)]|uniref:hypothetical protein n=1 Tax=Rothia sp. (in: high G+C Gram-positive bacteria) TaxID=1885016 RepID=UPI0026E03FD6|nr:hypothetical protein [Rothia sp. (in: high G+C Gram-positive bacteria)]MDO5751263.1 hypothetical protein [Rothia sp. (in: high G+C Gram-positive bacteria)]